MLNSFLSKHTRASKKTAEAKPELRIAPKPLQQPEPDEAKSRPEVFNTYKNDTKSSMNVITNGSLMEGTIKVAGEKGEIKIAGKIIGDVICSGKVIVEESGIVEGNINTLTLEIAGTLKGKADVAEECMVSSTGYIEGDILIGVLNINAGAKINGNIQMQGAEKPEPVNETVTSVNVNGKLLSAIA